MNFLHILLASFMFSPLIGVILVENGAYSLSTGMFGFENGVSFSYILFLITFFITVYLMKQVYIPIRFRPEFCNLEYSLRNTFMITTIFNWIVLLILLFLFSGYKVILGEVGKGEFRISLGFFGSVAYLCTKFYVPVLLVYTSYLYKKIKKFRNLLIINYIIAIIIGATWGFKTTSIFMILPGLIVLLWNTKFYKISLILILFFLFVLGTSIVFDEHDFMDALDAIFLRLTVIQGDMLWHMWNLHNQSILPLDNYLVTLLSSLGDKFLKFFSIFTEEEWIFYHYHLIITYLSGYEDAGLSVGHSVTANIFGESISIFKYPMNNLFAILAGIIVGLNLKLIQIYYYNNYPILLSLSLVFFVSYVIPWLNSGGIVTILHASSLLGILSSLFLLKFIKRVTYR